MTGGNNAYPQSYKRLQIFQFSTYIFPADITPEMLKLCRITNVKVFFLLLVYVFNFDLFKFSAAILEKGLLENARVKRLSNVIFSFSRTSLRV